jgi:hypothetical protein
MKKMGRDSVLIALKAEKQRRCICLTATALLKQLLFAIALLERSLLLVVLTREKTPEKCSKESFVASIILLQK